MPNFETQPFWDAAENGRLLLKQCTACGKPHHYPRSLCPFCFSDRTDWSHASGRGSVYAFSIARRATPPYVVAYVVLNEGPMVLTHIVDCAPEDVRIGQAVEVAFGQDHEGRTRPFFKPTAKEATP